MPELPPPLPPAERTVGQLVAETIRAYGGNFWRVLPLGIPIAVVESDLARLRRERADGGAVRVRAVDRRSPTSTPARSCTTRGRPGRVCDVAMLIFAPVPLLERAAVLPAVAWLALFGLAPAAAMIERLGFRASLDRGRRLGAADYVHALGSLATLVIVVVVAELTLIALLQSQGDNGQRIAHRPRRSRAQPAPLPRWRSPLYRPGRQGRLPPTTPKEPRRCRSSSSCRR